MAPSLPSPASRGGNNEASGSENSHRCACPFCKSNDIEVISLFGSQVMTMQCKCRVCGSYFEASKY